MLDPTTDVGRALLENLVAQQAAIIAYANDFQMLAIMTLLAFPLILLIKPPRLMAAPATTAAAEA
jgi:DHA2 family multidrug resistance protein